MRFDVRTYDVRPRSVPEVESRLAIAFEEQSGRSQLLASFHTEIGPLNQVIQIRSFESARGRELVHEDAALAASSIGELLLDERSDEIVPFRVSPGIPTTTVGPFFEIRTYRYAAGDLADIVDAWEAALPARLALGPLVLVGSSAHPGADTLLHIWPYRSLDERWALRRDIRAARAWPPHAVAKERGLAGFELLRMENKIVVAAPFSPLQ